MLPPPWCPPVPGGVAGDVCGLHPPGSRSGTGCGVGHRAAHCGLQDSVVSVHGHLNIMSEYSKATTYYLTGRNILKPKIMSA